MTKDLGLIFFENPISRSYLEICKINNFKFKKIIVLQKKRLFSNYISQYYNFYKMNSHALNFIKDKNYKKAISEISSFFGFSDNFFSSTYSLKNLKLFSNDISYLQTEDIDSTTFINEISNNNEINFLNTGNKIYKEIFNHQGKIIHIHPGFLPNVRGADASLWNIKRYNFLGVSSFIMDKKIDNGQILFKDKFVMPKFSFTLLKNYSFKTIYRFWFSFVDPLIRAKHFEKNFLKVNGKNLDLDIKVKDESNYFSYMDSKSIIDVTRKVFQID